MLEHRVFDRKSEKEKRERERAKKQRKVVRVLPRGGRAREEKKRVERRHTGRGPPALRSYL